VGEGTTSWLQIPPHEGSATDLIDREAEPLEETTGPLLKSEFDVGRRRFTWASLIAMAVTGVPFMWILLSDWGPIDPVRRAVYQDNFYDQQARAMFHGHLSLASGSLGLEGFVYGGRTYTYFGLFPSIIRMPIFLFTSSLDGKLTPTSTLAAWLLTGLFSALLLWKVRFLVRGDAAMGRAEATAFGALMATIMGGTIWFLLAATPFVFNEDIAWSICLTIGSIFALLGVMERPSWLRVISSGVLILCANLDRATTGWACVVGAGLIALWFVLGFGGPTNRRWCVPLLGVALIPLVISCVVNHAKFGVWFGVSNTEQVWTHVNAYRRKFLAANHGAEEGIVFIPTNLLTYFRPDGLSFSGVFPYVGLPSSPPTPVGGVLFDRLYRTSSITASMPLFFLLSLWGLVTAFRPRAVGRVALTRLLLLAAGSAGAALMLWGYIAPRYLGDFVPFLVLASAVAMADIFRRLESQSRSRRVGAVGVISILALFGIAANFGMAVVPVADEWDTTQVLNYVQTQKTLSDITGHPLNSNVVRGDSLPTWGPAGQLADVGNCSGLYISNGENYATVPSSQFTRATWMTVQLGTPFQHAFRVTPRQVTSSETQSVTLVDAGGVAFTVKATPTDGHQVVMTLGFYGPNARSVSRRFIEPAGTTHDLLVTTDPVKHQFAASLDGVPRVSGTFTTHGPIHTDVSAPPGDPSPRILTVTSTPLPPPTICQQLIH